MEILVYGAGAIGSVFGGFLSREHNVTLLGRPWHLQEVRRLADVPSALGQIAGHR